MLIHLTKSKRKSSASCFVTHMSLQH